MTSNEASKEARRRWAAGHDGRRPLTFGSFTDIRTYRGVLQCVVGRWSITSWKSGRTRETVFGWGDTWEAAFAKATERGK